MSYLELLYHLRSLRRLCCVRRHLCLVFDYRLVFGLQISPYLLSPFLSHFLQIHESWLWTPVIRSEIAYLKCLHLLVCLRRFLELLLVSLLEPAQYLPQLSDLCVFFDTLWVDALVGISNWPFSLLLIAKYLDEAFQLLFLHFQVLLLLPLIHILLTISRYWIFQIPHVVTWHDLLLGQVIGLRIVIVVSSPPSSQTRGGSLVDILCSMFDLHSIEPATLKGGYELCRRCTLRSFLVRYSFQWSRYEMVSVFSPKNVSELEIKEPQQSVNNDNSVGFFLSHLSGWPIAMKYDNKASFCLLSTKAVSQTYKYFNPRPFHFLGL